MRAYNPDSCNSKSPPLSSWEHPSVNQMWTKVMKEDWDRRAKENLTHYIAWNSGSELVNFFRNGKLDGVAVVLPVLRRVGLIAARDRILEIGCGIGRLFPGFEELGFKEVWGVDVSPEMIVRGRRACPVLHAHFLLGNGYDLKGVDSDYFDYCLSYNTLPHVPSRHIIWEYLAEVYRVLRPGGVFQLHLRATNPLKSRLMRGVPANWRATARSVYRLASLKKLHGRSARPTNGEYCMGVPGRLETWFGATVPRRQVVHRLNGLGFANVEILPDPTHSSDGIRFWVIGKKPPHGGQDGYSPGRP